VRARLPGLLAVLALLGAAFPLAAGAAVPANVKRVIADYRNDGRIDPCKHSAKDLRDTLKAISADTEQYAPDFPAAVEAALEARARGACDKKAAGGGGGGGGDGAGSAPAAPGAGGSAPPAPSPAPAPPPAAPSPGGEVVAEPPAPPASGAGITQGAPPPQDNRPNVVLTRPASGAGAGDAPLPVVVLGALLAACLLAGLALLAMRRFGWGEERLAGTRHAWAEASFRTGGIWQDFTDWVRLGR